MEARSGGQAWRGLLACLALMTVGAGSASAQAGQRATIANPGLEGQHLKTSYFFAGQARGADARQFYEHRPASNVCLNTVRPLDERHLRWSESAENREFAVAAMKRSGVNAVTMSSWGATGSDRWAFWAPMQTSTGAQDELFDAARAHHLLITPAIESSAATAGRQQTGCYGDRGPLGTSEAYSFADDFPGSPADPSPGLVAQVEDLLRRYVVKPRNRERKPRWTQIYDREGKPRYAVHIIHAASNQLCPARVACSPDDDRRYAAGFGWAADRIYRDTGVRVGFLIDALPQQTRLGFNYVPDPVTAGPLLEREPAVLGVQSFIPEIFMGPCGPDSDCAAAEGSPELSVLIALKQAFTRSWIATGVPVVLDVSSGYDGHIVFPAAPRYGNNAQWREGQEEMLGYGVAGLAFNSWNGYTEGMSAVPVCGVAGGPAGLPACPGVDGGSVAYGWWAGLALPASP